jgi:hypothetical protein
MRKILVLNLMLLLSACATVNKSDKTAVVTNESSPKVVEIPVTTVDFPSDALDSEFKTETLPLQDVCADEYLLFLIKYPFEGLNALKHSYDAAVLFNQDMQKLITLTVESRVGQLSMKDYVEEVTPINEELDFMNAAMEPLLIKFATIERTTRTLYPLCQEKLKATMTAKKLDANGDGCELEQQSAYIADPYEVKSVINDGLMTEAMISEKLNSLYKIVFDETQGNTNLKEATSKFNQQMNELNASGLFSKSSQLLEKIVRSFQATMDVKESCEKAPKK